ncbi:MAG: alpha/beta hydrolase [Rhodobacteraceae bacterium]|nr:alpha/beta hydrolase [Paracoccaceae bacterium]
MTYLAIFLLVIAVLPYAAEARRKPMDASARVGATGAFATLSQGTTFYEWLGPTRGPVAVCVHGLTTPSFVWRGLARGLARIGYRVLIYDLYGRGYSDRVTGRQDQAFFQRQLNDLLDDQNIEGDITLLGYSMGGAIATGFTAAHPDKVRQLILLASAGMGVGAKRMTRFIARTPVIGDWLFLALFARTHRKGCEAERHLPSSVENIIDLQLNELRYKGFVPAVLASIRGILASSLTKEHKAIHRAGIPVLAVWGSDDALIPLTAMGNLTEWSRDVRQDVIDGSGHGLTYTHTDAVLASISGALKGGLN